MMKKLLSLLVGTVLCAGAAIANASIIYSVNRTIGAGSVTGFIETNGTIGVLASSNIVDYSLTLTSTNLFGGSPQTITPASQSQMINIGDALSASATNLIFDFGVPNSAWGVQSNSSSLPYYGLGTADLCSAGGGGGCVGEYFGWNLNISGPAEVEARSGRVVFASAVPEPASLALLGIGLAGIGMVRQKKQTTAKT